MDKALYVAMSGARQLMLAQQGHANNLANVNTNGFRADFHQARSMPVFGEHHPSRVYAETERPATDFSMGSLVQTGRELDMAIQGAGFIAVQSADGSEAYTRDGSLAVDVDGTLKTSTGIPVIGEGGPIILPPADTITIGVDGTLSIVEVGQPPDALVAIDRVKLVNPDPATLEKGLDGLIRLKPPEEGAPPAPDAGVAPLDPLARVATG